MDRLISIERLIREAKKKGVDFGKGDPYNRLRYYTKMGWLPHTVRKQNTKGDVRGHYPYFALDHLLLIEDLKAKGYSNDEITKKLEAKNKIVNVLELFKDRNTRTQILLYAGFVMILIIFLGELGLLSIGKSKTELINQSMITSTAPQVIDNGNGFVPMGQDSVFIKTSLVNRNMNVTVTFNQDYSPATRYWIENISDYQGFELKLDAPVSGNPEFNWIVSK